MRPSTIERSISRIGKRLSPSVSSRPLTCSASLLIGSPIVSTNSCDAWRRGVYARWISLLVSRECASRLLKEGGELANFFEYQRSRARIARATALNSLFGIVVVVLVWSIAKHRPASDRVGAGLGIGLLGLGVLSEFAYRRIDPCRRETALRRLPDREQAEGQGGSRRRDPVQTQAKEQGV